MNNLDKQLLLDIVSVLNTPTESKEKQISLRAMQNVRRGDNKKLLYIIAELLGEHILPIHFQDTIDLYCLNNASENIYHMLKDVLKHSKNKMFNSICGEILWIHYRDFNYAKDAIESYTSVLNEIPNDDEMN